MEINSEPSAATRNRTGVDFILALSFLCARVLDDYQLGKVPVFGAIFNYSCSSRRREHGFAKQIL
jgi:hypothetical protein